MDKVCPCCNRHCPVDALSCPRGRQHFHLTEGGEGRPPFGEPHDGQEEENAIMLLRKCGHFLHHSVGHGGDADALLSAFTPEERATLEALLKKCLAAWQK